MDRTHNGGIIAVVIAVAIAAVLKAEENSNEANACDFVHTRPR